MEKKKILLVAVSVGIFLVIAIGAAILIFSPRSGVPANAVVMDRPNQGAYSPSAAPESIPVYPRLADPSAGLQNPAAPGLQTPATPGFGTPSAPDSAYQLPQNPSAAPSGTAFQENDFYINGKTQSQPYYTEGAEAGNNERAAPPKVVVSVPRPESVKIPVPPETAPAVSRPAAPKPAASTARPAASKPAASPARPAAAPKPAAAKTAAASGAAAKSRAAYDAWWVQAGSFSTKLRADGAKETLASRGITSIVENRDMDGKTFYRIRIGPYVSQDEADYWLALIQSLDGFESSLVWKSPIQRLN
jgi:DedD protein